MHTTTPLNQPNLVHDAEPTIKINKFTIIQNLVVLGHKSLTSLTMGSTWAQPRNSLWGVPWEPQSRWPLRGIAKRNGKRTLSIDYHSREEKSKCCLLAVLVAEWPPEANRKPLKIGFQKSLPYFTILTYKSDTINPPRSSSRLRGNPP